MFGPNFSKLPLEVLFEIFSNLRPETMTTIGRVNQNFKKITTEENSFWQKKFEQHFPDVFRTLDIKNVTNWYAEFRETYDDEYEVLPPPVRKIFSLIKENDVE